MELWGCRRRIDRPAFDVYRQVMSRGRWLLHLLAAGLVLIGATVSAGPAAAATCTGVNCYRYWVDMSFTGLWMTPSAGPVAPGSTYSFTALVTNTGWRTGGNTAPRPWEGPTSGVVYVDFQPGTTAGAPVGCFTEAPATACYACYNGGLVIDCQNIPTNTTYQLTTSFRAPQTPGTYTALIYIHDFQSPRPWSEYDPNNNRVTLTYQVG
ncbi:hypothetical protein [Dactylosporangium sp. NPDC050588]|uniref:hypothetical protein n=1 Tax=Dactylosporangium sp. NPDC050588 TaxID=3157211 RepID=UPI0033DD8167